MKISVIVPVYNVQEFVERCVESIIAQTYGDFELLLIDDGSTDESGKTVDRLGMWDPRISIYHKENGGLSDARNFGIDHAKGDFLTFIDSDDYIAPSYLEVLYNLIQKYGADVSCIQALETSERHYSQRAEYQETGVFNGIEAIKNSLLRRKFGVSAWGKLYSRKLFYQIRFPKGAYYEDFLTIPYIFEKCNKVSYADAKLYYYYQRPGSITNSRITEKHMQYFDNAKHLAEYFDQYGNDVHDAFVCRITGDSINRFAEILLFCDDYSEKIERVKFSMREYWKEAVSLSMIPATTKIQVAVLQRSTLMYYVCFKPYKRLKNMAKKKRI